MTFKEITEKSLGNLTQISVNAVIRTAFHKVHVTVNIFLAFFDVTIQLSVSIVVILNIGRLCFPIQFQKKIGKVENIKFRFALPEGFE